MKTVYCLRIRPDDKSPWSEPEYYQKRKKRDRDEMFNRCMGGMRTHSYQEERTDEDAASLAVND